MLKRRPLLSSPFQQPSVGPAELLPVLSLLEAGRMGEALKLFPFLSAAVPRPERCLKLLLPADVWAGGEGPRDHLFPWTSSVLCLFHHDGWGEHSVHVSSSMKPVQK